MQHDICSPGSFPSRLLPLLTLFTLWASIWWKNIIYSFLVSLIFLVKSERKWLKGKVSSAYKTKTAPYIPRDLLLCLVGRWTLSAARKMASCSARDSAIREKEGKEHITLSVAYAILVSVGKGFVVGHEYLNHHHLHPLHLLLMSKEYFTSLPYIN